MLCLLLLCSTQTMSCGQCWIAATSVPLSPTWVSLDTHTLSLQFRRGCGCRWAPIGGGRERAFVLRGSEAAGVSSACSAAEVKGHLY